MSIAIDHSIPSTKFDSILCLYNMPAVDAHGSKESKTKPKPKPKPKKHSNILAQKHNKSGLSQITLDKNITRYETKKK